MKRIRSLDDCPPGLASYLAEDIDDVKDWNGFRSHAAGASYLELAEKLVNNQHGLCGYCEIDIEDGDRQVEHVIPQSDSVHGATRVLDQSNMIACCKGGTLVTEDMTRRLDPVKRNRSCGESKENLVDADFIDPRTLPALPSLVRVNYDGRIEADTNSCENCNIDADKVERTIQILGLNTERLRRAREHRWNALNDHWGSDITDPEKMRAAARGELFPDECNRLPKFFTTNRSYFGVYAETVLSEPPQNWI